MQDPNLDIEIHAKKQLQAGGMDEKLATHFAHLFIRDPLTVYDHQVDAQDKDDTGLFDVIQSSNWQTIRFKPPPSMAEEGIGWRVEFRSMEVQLTDFENAAFATFIVLLSQALLHFDISLYTPIPKVDKNMDQACARDAVNDGRFWFVKPVKSHSKPSASTSAYSPAESLEYPDTSTNFLTMGDPPDNRESPNSSSEDENNTRQADGRRTSNSKSSDDSETPSSSSSSSCGKAPTGSNDPSSLMTIDEIINSPSGGTKPGLGLIPLVKEYIHDTAAFNPDCTAKIESYLALISNRARGSASTSAKWQRDFVRRHPEYRGDSVVGNGIAYDLLRAQLEISRTNGKGGGGAGAVGREMFVGM